jgi:hypothetical protein
MRMLVLAAVFAGAGWFIYHQAAERPWTPPPGYTAAMEHFANEASADWNGPKGEEARTVCKRVVGVTGPVNNATDLIRLGYSEATVEKFGDCVVNYMVPIDAKKNP